MDTTFAEDQLLHVQGSSPSISIDVEGPGDDDNYSDESAEEWVVDDESEGQIDRSLLDTPGEHLVFVYCKLI